MDTDHRNRHFLMGIRQLLIMALNLLEDFLGLDHTIPTKEERRWLRRIRRECVKVR